MSNPDPTHGLAPEMVARYADVFPVEDAVLQPFSAWGLRPDDLVPPGLGSKLAIIRGLRAPDFDRSDQIH